MNIMRVNRRGVCCSHVISRRQLLLLLLLLIGGGFGGGLYIAEHFAPVVPLPSDLLAELDEQRQAVASARQVAAAQVTTLTQRLAELDARIVRLDALGSRLVARAGLDDGEFRFGELPAQGGPDFDGERQLPVTTTLLQQLDALAQQIEQRDQQLRLLDQMVRHRELQQSLQPAGWPLVSGWISSPFGERTDPFSGELERHDGIDLAASEGAEVLAVAAGVVVFAGTRNGYGNLVEIDHGNGYRSRYAHNKSNLVVEGDRVEPGAVIAIVGSTGRSTGPHLHFEVVHNGKPVDPNRYLQAQR